MQFNIIINQNDKTVKRQQLKNKKKKKDKKYESKNKRKNMK